MKKIFEYINELFKNKGRKKIIENAAIVAIIGIVVVIAGGTLFDNKEKHDAPAKDEKTGAVETKAVPQEADDVKKQVESILSKISGAGKVEVMITYMSGSEIVPAYDSKKSDNGTDEKDNTGLSRSIKQNNTEDSVAYEEAQGIKKPVILKEILPKVKGVVVISDGASDAVVREKLTSAVKVLMDVPANRIQVFERAK